ncbi:SHOCT domain-containing protein [Pseudonocardia sp. KRD-182]|uniref:SHOCT domain-containing protein n=1 Tax=Pseudonocardia oceani TaxID=2792013 RepID=UPI001C49FDC6|nr:SHOCT domain-containing protein [Pseudonocardia oceani]MBW0108051.1 SHOCT domain-containing protein [Pseudonocardia oceani]
MMGGMTAGMGKWMLVVVLTVVALLVLATLGSVWFYRRLRGRQSDGAAVAGRDEQDTATRRLRERFAAGEIDEQEYESRLSALTHWR